MDTVLAIKDATQKYLDELCAILADRFKQVEDRLDALESSAPKKEEILRLSETIRATERRLDGRIDVLEAASRKKGEEETGIRSDSEPEDEPDEVMLAFDWLTRKKNVCINEFGHNTRTFHRFGENTWREVKP